MSNQHIKMEWLLQRLEGVVPRGDVTLARCPAHDDHRPSLSVAMGRKGFLLNCFAGCQLDAICDALGIRKAQLFYDYREHGNWQEEADMDRLMQELLKAHDPEYMEMPPFYGRVDEVMWHTLVTDKLPEIVWVRAMGMAGTEYPWLMGLTWPEAMQYRVVFRDGPLDSFLRPLWEHLGRPDFTKLKDYAMKRMAEEYTMNWALGGIESKDKELPDAS